MTIFHVVLLNIPHIQSECGEYLEILCGIFLVPQNIVMDLNVGTIQAYYMKYCPSYKTLL